MNDKIEKTPKEIAEQVFDQWIRGRDGNPSIKPLIAAAIESERAASRAREEAQESGVRELVEALERALLWAVKESVSIEDGVTWAKDLEFGHAVLAKHLGEHVCSRCQGRKWVSQVTTGEHSSTATTIGCPTCAGRGTVPAEQ